MTVTIRADGDWGGAQLRDVEAIASSAAASFDALEDGEIVAVALEPTRGEDDPPIALSRLSPSDEFVVRLNVRGNLWARLAFQFAHEFCHVLADTRTWTFDRFAWVEEALCETASLFALRTMGKAWVVAPPYPNWQDYAVALEAYAANRMADPAHSLPPGGEFSDWFRDRLLLLEADPWRRADNTLIAKEVLPVFESDATGWHAIRHLHTWPRPLTAPLAEFMEGWSDACPQEYRRVIESISRVIRPR